MNFAQPLILLLLTMTIHSIYSLHTQETTMDGIAQSIALQDEMEEKLAETFNILFSNFTKESVSLPNTFMYSCDEKCITNAAYEFGISSAFLLALLSERKFSIYPNKDSPFYSFYEELSYPWKMNNANLRNRTKNPMVPPSRYQPRFFADLLILEKSLSVMDFDSQFKDEIIYLSGNYDWILDLRRHANTAKKIPWLYSTHASNLIRLLHSGLFQLKQPIRSAIYDELIEKVGQNNLVCLNGNLNPKQQTVNFLNILLKKYSSNYKFYLTGVNLMFEKSPLLNVSDKMANINFRKMFKMITKHTQIHDHKIIQNLVDIHILKVCDVLIVSGSPTEILAAHLRRKNGDLYCLKNRVIFPCTRRLIARSFRDGEELRGAMDIKYFCKRVDNCGVIFS